MITVRLTRPLLLAVLSGALLLPCSGLYAQQENAAPQSGNAQATEPATPAAKPKKPTYSNKWRLEFSGNAESDGTITLKIVPKEGDAIETTTPIKKGTSENGVAKKVVKSLKKQLNKKVYHVERDDGEDVLIKKRIGAKDFDVQIIANTVKHVRIKRQKE